MKLHQLVHLIFIKSLKIFNILFLSFISINYSYAKESIYTIPNNDKQLIVFEKSFENTDNNTSNFYNVLNYDVYCDDLIQNELDCKMKNDNKKIFHFNIELLKF